MSKRRRTRSTKKAEKEASLYSVVWTKLPSYPYWPALICPESNKTNWWKKEENGAQWIHVQFFEKPPTQEWVPERLTSLFEKDTEYIQAKPKSKNYQLLCAAKAEAIVALKMTPDQRKSLIVNQEEDDNINLDSPDGEVAISPPAVEDMDEYDIISQRSSTSSSHILTFNPTEHPALPLSNLSVNEVDVFEPQKNPQDFLSRLVKSLSSSPESNLFLKTLEEDEAEHEYGYLGKSFERLSLSPGDKGKVKLLPERIHSMDIHPSEDTILASVGGKFGHLALWNLCDNSRVFYKPHSAPISCLTFDNYDGTKLISTSADGTTRSFDMNKGIFNLLYGASLSHLTCNIHAQLSRKVYLVSLGYNGVLGVVDIRTSSTHPVQELQVFPKGSLTTCVSTHPSEKFILVSENNGNCSIFDIRSSILPENPVVELRGHDDAWINSAHYSPILGYHILTVARDNKVRIYDDIRWSDPGERNPSVVFEHDNQTGPFITPLRSSWHPKREDVFFLGSLDNSIEIYNPKHGTLHGILKNEKIMNSPPAVVKSHSHLNVVLGGNALGEVYAFMETH